MANVVPLPQSMSAPTACDRYQHLLIPPYTELVPLAILPQLQSEIEASLVPAQLYEVKMTVAALGASLKMPGTIEDPEKFGNAMAIELAEYPADILKQAVPLARRSFDWFPSIREMIEICERLVGPRRNQLHAVQWMFAKHRWHEKEAEMAEAETRREAERKAQLQKLAARALEQFGDDAPELGDLELAASIAPEALYRAGPRVYWRNGLADGEPWAAQYVRLMALAARLKRAHDRGQISWEEALAAAKLITAAETSARRQIEDMEGREPKGWHENLTEGFWRALENIHKVCGGVMRPDEPSGAPDLTGAAADNPELRATLAEARTMLDKQLRDEWDLERRATR